MRVSSLPTLCGEKIVARILDKEMLKLDLTQLGFEEESLAALQGGHPPPWGIVLVTGPTGSGKTNTLYSAVSDHQLPGHEHHDGRGPGRVQHPGHQPGPGQGRDRADLRRLPADLPPPGPRHHARRRDARPGDRGHRHQGRPDGPPRLLHDPHERRREHDHPPGQHERRAVPHRRLAHPGRGPAAHPAALQKVRPAAQPARERPARDGLRKGRVQGPPHPQARRAATPATRPATRAGRPSSRS